MMQEDSSRSYYGTSSESTRRYEPPPEDFGSSSEDYYVADPMGKPLVPEGEIGERKANFPICKPIIHHNIATDIPSGRKTFVRKVYFGWYLHAFCLFWNFVCMTGGLILEGYLGGFFLAMIAWILGTPISFGVYFCLYSAVRKSSAFYFIIWFSLFVLQILAEAFLGIGLEGYGGIGWFTMVSVFSDGKTIFGILCSISAVAWTTIVAYNVWTFITARAIFRNLGGSKAAMKQGMRQGAQTAYDNRKVIKEVVVENKDVIVDFAKEHKDEIIDFAKQNKDVVAQVAYENKDTIWENRDVVSSVFDEEK